MYLPSFNLCLTAWLLSSFVGCIQNEPQRPYHVPYNVQGSAQGQYYLETPLGRIEPYYRTSLTKPVQPANIPNPFPYNYQHLPANSRVPFNAYKTNIAPMGTLVPKSIYPNEQTNRAAVKSHEIQGVHSHGDGKEYSEENDVLFQEFERLSEDGGPRDDEILKKMVVLAKALEDPSENDVETKNSIEDRVSLSDMPEETKRVVRQVRKQKPGFFWTLARVTFETFNDTRSAIKQLGEILNNYIVPDSTTQRAPRTTTTTTTTPADDQNKLSSNVETVDVTTTSPAETTTEMYKFSPGIIQSLVRRNLKGLVRLFNIEWKDALAESETSVREFRKDLGNQIGLYLQDNPKAY